MKWIRLNDVIIGDLSSNKVVLTMTGNNRMFAYNISQGIKGLCEVQKHHPEALCLIVEKPSQQADESQEQQPAGEQDELWEEILSELHPYFLKEDYEPFKEKFKQIYLLIKK